MVVGATKGMASQWKTALWCDACGDVAAGRVAGGVRLLMHVISMPDLPVVLLLSQHLALAWETRV